MFSSLRKIKRIYIAFISKLIWISEFLFVEPKLKKIYCKFKKSGYLKEYSTVIDVGANRGQAARFFRRLLPKSKIISIEANPDLIPLLRKETQQIDVEILPIALSDKSGNLTFYSCAFDEVSTLEPPLLESSYLRFKSRVLATPVKDMYQTKKVKAETFDEVIYRLNISSIDILKIDVEGHEASVLRGSKLSLSKRIPKLIQIESHADDQYAHDKEEAKSILLENGYNLVYKVKHAFGNFFEEIYVPVN